MFTTSLIEYFVILPSQLNTIKLDNVHHNPSNQSNIQSAIETEKCNFLNYAKEMVKEKTRKKALAMIVFNFLFRKNNV